MLNSYIDRRTALLGLTSALLAACGGGGDVFPIVAAPLPFPIQFPPPPGTLIRAAPLDWALVADAANDEWTTGTTKAPLSGLQYARNMAAIMTAGHDALNAVVPRHVPIVHAAEVDLTADGLLAFAAAAHRVVSELWQPTTYAGDVLAAAQAKVVDESVRRRSVEIGLACAQAMLDTLSAAEQRVQCGLPNGVGSAPGLHVPVSQFRCSNPAPLALESPDQFRAGYPPVLTSDTYSVDFDEVRTKGRLSGSTRDAYETFVAETYRGLAAKYWQSVAADVIRAAGLDGHGAVRLCALLHIAISDAMVAAHDSKFAYWYWRPQAAIRQADSDGNPTTSAELQWLPLVETSSEDTPAYPSAFAAAAGAAGNVLAAFGPRVYPNEVGQTQLLDIAADVAQVPVLAGANFSFAVTAGLEQGTQVAGWVLTRWPVVPP